MTRNLKSFGLTLMVALAVGAIGAQAAPAVVEHTFSTGATDAVLTGNGENNQVFSFAGVPVECTTATFEGTNAGENRDTWTVHPKYSSCTAFGAGATVSTNGCNYIFDSETTTHSHSVSSSEDAAMSIECQSSHGITISAVGCTLRIADLHTDTGPPHIQTTVNQSLHGVRYTGITHSSKGSITMTSTVSTVHYTAQNFACMFAGISVGTHTDGAYTGAMTVTAFEGGSVAGGDTTVGRTWSHGAQVGINLSTP